MYDSIQEVLTEVRYDRLALRRWCWQSLNTIINYLDRDINHHHHGFSIGKCEEPGARQAL